MQIERFSTQKGEYMKLSFLKWDEYADLIMDFKKYVDLLKSNNQSTTAVEKIINELSINRKPTQEFAITTTIKPNLYFDFFCVMYDAILKVNTNDNYKKSYEDAIELCQKLQNELIELSDEANKTFKQQEYEIKKLKSELKKYEENK